MRVDIRETRDGPAMAKEPPDNYDTYLYRYWQVVHFEFCESGRKLEKDTGRPNEGD
jgi:hypothetical protein